MTKPLYRNFVRHDFLIDTPRTRPWLRTDLARILPHQPIFICVYSTDHQWVFVHDPEQFRRTEFCNWLETVGSTLKTRATWPDLYFATDPAPGWCDAAFHLPCRSGPSLWDLFTARELAHCRHKARLPHDFHTRQKPDEIH